MRICFLASTRGLRGASVPLVAALASIATHADALRAVGPPFDRTTATIAALLRDSDPDRTSASLRVISGEHVREEGRLHLDSLLGSLAGVTRQSDGNGASVFHLRGASLGPAGPA